MEDKEEVEEELKPENVLSEEEEQMKLLQR